MHENINENQSLSLRDFVHLGKRNTGHSQAYMVCQWHKLCEEPRVQEEPPSRLNPEDKHMENLCAKLKTPSSALTAFKRHTHPSRWTVKDGFHRTALEAKKPVHHCTTVFSKTDYRKNIYRYVQYIVFVLIFQKFRVSGESLIPWWVCKHWAYLRQISKKKGTNLFSWLYASRFHTIPVQQTMGLFPEKPTTLLRLW